MMVAGVLYFADLAIKKALLAAKITFPSSLVGMFGIVAVLLAAGEKTASK
jgi:hypothetical protein